MRPDCGAPGRLTGGGGNDNGKCTIEVYVDGSADVEIRGDRGFLRTLSGQPAQWRRFRMFRADARQSRVIFGSAASMGAEDRNVDPGPEKRRGAAVVRIQDPDGGAEGYTFDLVWRGGGFGSSPTGQPLGGRDRGASPNDAVRACQDAVRERANQQYGLRDIDFRNLNADDNPGRNDTIMGSFDARRGNDRDTYRFSCAVDLANGRVRRVDISQGRDAAMPIAMPAGTTASRHASVRPSSRSSAMDTGTCNSVGRTLTTAETTGLPGLPQRNGATTGAHMTSRSVLSQSGQRQYSVGASESPVSPRIANRRRFGLARPGAPVSRNKLG